MSIQSELKTRFGDAVIETYLQKDGKPGLVVKPEALLEICNFLHDSGFDHLSLISGTDYVERMEVVYHIWSYTRKENIVLKVKLDRDNPVVDSVTAVWRGANWMERETYDLVGIEFKGHPDLRRILLPDPWDGHPLRRDYDMSVDQYVYIDENGKDVVTQDASKILREEALDGKN